MDEDGLNHHDYVRPVMATLYLSGRAKPQARAPLDPGLPGGAHRVGLAHGREPSPAR
jgi:hypothetical protein